MYYDGGTAIGFGHNGASGYLDLHIYDNSNSVTTNYSNLGNAYTTTHLGITNFSE
jgi:hypothetical protein